MWSIAVYDLVIRGLRYGYYGAAKTVIIGARSGHDGVRAGL